MASTSGKASSGEIPPKADRFGKKHAGEGNHRPDRQIDTAAEDHEGHADGDDPKESVIGQNIANHPRRSKTRKLGQAVEIAQHEYREGDHQR